MSLSGQYSESPCITQYSRPPIHISTGCGVFGRHDTQGFAACSGAYAGIRAVAADNSRRSEPCESGIALHRMFRTVHVDESSFPLIFSAKRPCAANMVFFVKYSACNKKYVLELITRSDNRASKTWLTLSSGLITGRRRGKNTSGVRVTKWMTNVHCDCTTSFTGIYWPGAAPTSVRNKARRSFFFFWEV